MSLSFVIAFAWFVRTMASAGEGIVKERSRGDEIARNEGPDLPDPRAERAAWDAGDGARRSAPDMALIRHHRAHEHSIRHEPQVVPRGIEPLFPT